MGLINSIRQAEERGRRTLTRAREGLDDVQRRLRQKMRIYPRKSAAAPADAKTINARKAAGISPGTEEEFHAEVGKSKSA